MVLIRTKIVVVPLGEVDYSLVSRMAQEIGPCFNRAVDILRGMAVPDEALNVVRNQYYALVILNKLERVKSNSREKVIAVCEEDLYVPDEDQILSYADSLSGAAVVSLNHMRQEFYGLPEDDGKVYPRLLKESMHRMAHLFGLPECRNARCVNYYSRLMLDIDHKGDKLCDMCRRELTRLL
jgi:predicted Zn-dependent protease